MTNEQVSRGLGLRRSDQNAVVGRVAKRGPAAPRTEAGPRGRWSPYGNAQVFRVRGFENTL